MSEPDEICAALHTVYARLDALARIATANALLPVGPQAYSYQGIIEETYAALGRVETALDALRTELEYQHQRLDEARDAVFDAALGEDM